MSKSVVFIHGAWVTPLCWERFLSFFEERGYQTLAPPWPGKEISIEEQRASPSSTLRGLGIKEIVDYYAALITGMLDQPVIVGHSFGGLFVQLLLDRGLGSAGVAIDSAPPKGVFAFYPTAIRSLARVLTTWKGWDRVLRMPFSDFRYAFLNTVPPDKQRAIYDRYVVPETGQVFFQAALSLLSPNSATTVRFRNPARPPLLLVAGGSDHIVPPQINRTNYRKHRHTQETTAFKEFPRRGHWIIAEEGWEEVAGYISEWISALPTQSRSGAP
ncbi:MAG: alpha/beta hydrolase [Chloroflexi bacterium]|nr:alpha/beta hydrolase [Chloroflexota bacterium]